MLAVTGVNASEQDATTDAVVAIEQHSDPVMAITQHIGKKRSEIATVEKTIETESDSLRDLEQQQVQLKREYIALDTKLNRAKSALDKQFARLVEEPDVDLDSFQKDYQDAWNQVKDNQQQRLVVNQTVAENKMRLTQIKQRKAILNSELENLTEAKISARVKRLNAELRDSAVIDTNYQTTCARNMTLSGCSKQGRHLTQQKAVKIFKEQLIAQLSESDIARRNLNEVQFNIHIQESQITKAHFSGENAYYTELQAQLQARPETTAACKLLNVSSRYCLSGHSQSQNKKQWANITVRSNQYGDNVTINGVKYGSTPVDIVLPPGKHRVSVTKKGFESYSRVIQVRGNSTIWAKLTPNKQS